MIEKIREDRVHGASWLSRAAVGVLVSASKFEADDSKQTLNILFNISKRLVNIRPSMAPLANIVATLMHEIREGRTMSLPEMRKMIEQKAFKLLENSDISAKEAAEKASELLEGVGTVITNSFSSTVLEALSRLPDIKVMVPESRPLLEGRRLAEELSRRNIRVVYIVDSAMGLFSEKADAAIVGADSVLADGSVVNKIGTKMLALSAKDRGIPFYAVCESMKFDVRNYLGQPLILEEKDPSEVASGLTGVEIRNPYFEITPSRFVTSIVTELGPMNERTIRLKMEEMSGYLRPLLN